MKLLTEDAVLLCNHKLGKVAVVPSQSWVTVESRRVLIHPDPEHRSIKGCPELPPVSKPCLTTLNVRAGYSDLVRIDGQAVCLGTLTGLTDGNPPGVANYAVNRAGQGFVEEDA